MSYILECSIHHYRGNEEKAEAWVNRISSLTDKNVSTSEMKDVQYGDFLYFDGRKISVINNNNYKYEPSK